jgi:hypothetical protein
MISGSGFRTVAAAFLAVGMIATLSSCGDSKYHPPAIVVTFSDAFPPPTALDTDTTVGIAAVVTNDANNPSVNFSCTPVGACGTFTPTEIGSNVPTSYESPSAVPAGGAVTVTATSVTDPTKSVSATITIN